MEIILLELISTLSLTVNCYRFEAGYVEVWYQIPISQIFSPQELKSTAKDTIFIKYSYRFDIYDENKKDSSYIEGIKGTYITPKQQKDYFIDYLPVSLYPGVFSYRLEIRSGAEKSFYESKIAIPSDTILFYCSDLVLGKRNNKDFIFHKLAFTPSIISDFVDQDTLFSYLEIYGLTPDSLFYNVKYQINTTDNIFYERSKKRLKYADIQIDTFSVGLHDLVDGNYTFLVEVYDSALNSSISCKKAFSVKSLFDDIARMKFYSDIQYLVSDYEYNNFCHLNGYQKKIYLKKFWSKNNYWEVEKRLLEADEKFSLRLLKGRDSERGKLYIKNGPPDDIEVIAMAGWARPFEVWHYFSKGYDVLFCDIKDDGNPRLIKTFKTGELIEILQYEVYKGEQEDWHFEIGPGTYDKREKERPE